MEHWRTLLPGVFYELNYESMLADQKQETRRLLEYCGLEWSEDCMNFFANPRRVQTASAAQVRKPLNSDSSGRWRHYAAQLQPVIEQLGLTEWPV